jgi:D-serine dehydratase
MAQTMPAARRVLRWGTDMTVDLTAIENEIIDSRFKGFPVGAAPVVLKEVGTRKWSLLRHDLPFPVAVIKGNALHHNRNWMRDFAGRNGVLLAPHGKTTMAPQIFAMQLEAGAWGITVATVNQLDVCIRFGLRRIIMANQLVGARDIASVIALLNGHPDLELHFLLDSRAQLDILSALSDKHGLQRRFNLLLEIGYAGGRTGCRSEDEALALARAARASGRVRLVGIECFEGLAATGDSDADWARVRRLTDMVKAVAAACDREGLFDSERVILSAGGSAVFDIVARELSTALSRPVQAILRSGCYITHDSGFYDRMLKVIGTRSVAAMPQGSALQHALEVWSLVQSLPEPGRAILTMGRRDVSYDLDLPRPLSWYRPGEHEAPAPSHPSWRISGLNDQHAYMEISPDSGLKVGDMIGCGISHPCTTFDKWQLLWMVDERYEVTSAIRTFF